MAYLKPSKFKGVDLHFEKKYVAGKHLKTHTYIEGHWNGDAPKEKRFVTAMTKEAAHKKLVTQLKKCYPKSFKR
jgi:hypothetical protein